MPKKKKKKRKSWRRYRRWCGHVSNAAPVRDPAPTRMPWTSRPGPCGAGYWLVIWKGFLTAGPLCSVRRAIPAPFAVPGAAPHRSRFCPQTDGGPAGGGSSPGQHAVLQGVHEECRETWAGAGNGIHAPVFCLHEKSPAAVRICSLGMKFLSKGILSPGIPIKGNPRLAKLFRKASELEDAK